MKQICKECWEEKELTEFYSHPQWKNWVLWRCKECIKKGRKSSRERELARKWEKDNRIRPKWYWTTMCKKFRQENPEKYNAHKLVQNYLRRNFDVNPYIICKNCWTEWKLHMHHIDYNKPNIVIPLCPLCHSNVHNNTIKIKDEWIITLPF